MARKIQKIGLGGGQAAFEVTDSGYIVSYDGRRGDKTFGELLPASLDLAHIELDAGRSSQSTLLGRDEVTYESLYLSQALTDKISHKPTNYHRPYAQQFVLLEPAAHYA